MTTPHLLEGRPDRAFLAALVAIVLAAVAFGFGFYFHFTDQDRNQKRDRDAFCGLVVPISEQHAASPLGVTIVNGAQRAVTVLHCPTKGN